MKKIVKNILILLALVTLLLFIDKYLPAMLAEKLPKADKVLVKKSERRLFLMKNNSVIKSYKISLGKNPTGHKKRQGDSKTPEGNYFLDYRNPRSSFHLSLHISYPNKFDIRQADRNGYSAGGNIMIHGKPNFLGWVPFFFDKIDWTDGCVAVGNVEIEEIWNAVDDNTTIELLP